MATDAELNAYESLRKIAPYRHQASHKDNKKRKKVKELRKIIASRRWGDELPIDDDNLPFSTKYGTDGGKKRKSENETPHRDNTEGPKEKKKRLGAKQRKKLKARVEEEIDQNRPSDVPV